MKVSETIMDNEKVLILQLKQGSHKAFDRIYRLYSGRLYSYCYKYVKITEDVEEIVEDVFIQLWNRRETIKNEECIESFLFTICKYRIINAYRVNVNSPVFEEYIACRNEDLESSFYTAMEYQEFLDRLKHALSKLSPTQQKVITLSKFQGMQNKKIAETLSISEQTVKNQLSLGLKQLRALLAYHSVLFIFVKSMLLSVLCTLLFVFNK